MIIKEHKKFEYKSSVGILKPRRRWSLRGFDGGRKRSRILC